MKVGIQQRNDLTFENVKKLILGAIAEYRDDRKHAELALRHAEAMLAIMVDIAVNGQSEAVRLAAADKVIDRAMGKAPAHIDITAMRTPTSSTSPPRSCARNFVRR